MPVTPSFDSMSADGPAADRDRLPVDATGRVPATGERALVLGGGGSTGNAWLIGVVAGLSVAGLDVTAADLTIGTSAGSTAAAQFAGATPAELYAAVLAAPVPNRAGPSGVAGSAPTPHRVAPSGGAGAGPARPVTDQLARMRTVIAAAANAADLRRRLGAAALQRDAESDGTFSTQWRATVAARLPDRSWPQRTVLITAVDARTGDPVVFDRHSGIDLADAVAASCSSGLPYRIGDGRYLDGGFRANAENADLAAGFARVLVLSPFGGRSLVPAEWGTHLATQVDELRARGSRVETIGPTPDAEYLFGVNGMDLSLRLAAARAGYQQGRGLAGGLAGFWR